MKKCVVMFTLLIVTFTIAVLSDEEKEISEKDTLLEHNIQGTDLAHQGDTEMESAEVVSSYLLEENQ